MKKAGAMALLFCALMLLGACAPFAQNTADLLRAPALGFGYDEIQSALGSYLGGEEPRYKYPKEGDLRSPLIRADLDGDGVEEAVVLYGTDDNSVIGIEKGSNVYLAVLKSTGEGWQVVWDEQGLDTDVASLEVADLLEDGTRQLIVGYASGTLGFRTLALYTFDGGSLERVYTQNYSRYEIGDFTGRGSSELIVVSRDDEPGLMLHYLLTRDGAFVLDEPAEPVKLDMNFVSCQAIVASAGKNGESILLVDGMNATADSGGLTTQIVYYAEGRFYVIDDAGAMRGATARANLLLTSRDIDGDGVAEVPLRDGRREIQTPEADKRLEYVRWVDFVSGDEPVYKRFGILDSDRSVFIHLPDAWRGQISVVDGEEKGEWHIQNRSTLVNLVSMRIIEAGGSAPAGALRVPGTTSSYLVVNRGTPEAERESIKMTSMV